VQVAMAATVSVGQIVWRLHVGVARIHAAVMGGAAVMGAAGAAAGAAAAAAVAGAAGADADVNVDGRQAFNLAGMDVFKKADQFQHL